MIQRVFVVVVIVVAAAAVVIESSGQREIYTYSFCYIRTHQDKARRRKKEPSSYGGNSV